jgi:hypothetical protein
MIDPFRPGGITPWLEIAKLGHARDGPVVSPLAPEIQLQLIAASRTGGPWNTGLGHTECSERYLGQNRGCSN